MKHEERNYNEISRISRFRGWYTREFIFLPNINIANVPIKPGTEVETYHKRSVNNISFNHENSNLFSF